MSIENCLGVLIFWAIIGTCIAFLRFTFIDDSKYSLIWAFDKALGGWSAQKARLWRDDKWNGKGRNFFYGTGSAEVTDYDITFTILYKKLKWYKRACELLDSGGIEYHGRVLEMCGDAPCRITITLPLKRKVDNEV